MAIMTRLVELNTTTPVQVVGADNMDHEVHLHNMTKNGSHYVFIGGDDSVADDNTLHLDPGESKVLTLMPGDELWAVSSHSDMDLGVLDIRRND